MDSSYFVFALIFGCIFGRGYGEPSLENKVSNGGVGLLGDNPVTITCTAVKNDAEQISTIRLKKRTTAQTEFESIALFVTLPTTSSERKQYEGTSGLQDRSQLSLNMSDTGVEAVLTIQRIECSDEADYQCFMEYIDSAIKGQEKSAESSLSVQVAATNVGSPPVMNPLTNIYENQTVEFRCSGKLGNPPGTIKWSRTRGDVTTGITEGITANRQEDSCGFTGTSVLKYTLLREDNGAQIGCVMQQSEYLTNPVVKNTAAIGVFYEPFVTGVQPDIKPSYTEATGQLRLTCNGEGNPTPDFKWVHEVDKRETDGPDLTLTNLKTNQTGNYICVVNNSFNGISYSHNISYYISIVETTTKAPTTTPITQSTSDEKPTPPTGSPSTGGLTEEEKTIVIVVVVVVVVIVIIIVVVVICLRRRGKKQPIEEPPEKPRNNQDLSFYGNKPDLVSADEKPSNLDYNNSQSTLQSYKNEDGLNYAVFNLDDKPRSRKPLQISEGTPYAEIAMPSV